MYEKSICSLHSPPSPRVRGSTADSGNLDRLARVVLGVLLQSPDFGDGGKGSTLDTFQTTSKAMLDKISFPLAAKVNIGILGLTTFEKSFAVVTIILALFLLGLAMENLPMQD